MDTTKLEQTLHYIIHKTMDKKVYKTHLYKILYFLDFDFYELHNKDITGETYVKIKNGPAPRNFDKVVENLKKKKKIEEKRLKIKDFIAYTFHSLFEPDISNISNEELSVINNSIAKCSSMTATQLSEYSHGDTPWIIAKNNENLDLELVFYRNKQYSVIEENVPSE